MNKIILLGRLTKDPETRYTKNNNTMVVNFTLAVDRKFTKEGEEQQTDFINIIAFGKTAEFIQKYYKKGQQVLVVGRLQTRIWEDEENKRHYVSEVITEETYFADSRKSQIVDASILNGGSENKLPAQEDDDTICSDDDLPF